MTRVDMSPRAIEERLQAASRQSPLDFHPLPRIDMSPAAIEARVLECAELSGFCRALATAAPPRVESKLRR